MTSYLLGYMESYLLECGIIFIGIWHHIYWNEASYLWEYGIIFIYCYIATVIKITSKKLQA